MPSTTTARRYVTPDPDVFAGNVGQLVMGSSAVKNAAAAGAFPEGETDALVTGRVIGRYWHGDQYYVTWDNGRTTWEGTHLLEEIQAVRFVAGPEARAEVLVYLVVPAILPRYTVHREVFHWSTDHSLGYKLCGFTDVMPDPDDDPDAWVEAYYVDRWNLDRVWSFGRMKPELRSPECTCQCHRGGDDEPPF